MCINAETSLASFAIGSVCCYVLYKRSQDPSAPRAFRAMALMWQYALFMQLVEFAAWMTQPGTGALGALNQIAKGLAAFLNMTQPIAAYLILFKTFNHSIKSPRAVAALIPCLLYTGAASYMLYTGYNSSSKTLSPSPECAHLQYDWWKGQYSGTTLTLYLLSIAASTLLLTPTNDVRDLRVGALNLAYMVLTLLVSSKMYSCGTPSMWCWLVVAAPALNLLLV